MIDLIISAIISSQSLAEDAGKRFENDLNGYESYINYQLKENYLETRTYVVFSAEIPNSFHSRIRQDAEKAGWSVSIESVPGFYQYQETYRFTFNKL